MRIPEKQLKHSKNRIALNQPANPLTPAKAMTADTIITVDMDIDRSEYDETNRSI